MAANNGFVAMDVSARTLADTALGDWERRAQRQSGTRPLAAGDPLGGHFVMGHAGRRGGGGSAPPRTDAPSELVLSVARELKKFIRTQRESVALDGVSLTVNDVSRDSFSVNLVPHTLKETTLSECRPGSRLNLEVDIIARYAARLPGGS